jgi:hypothetical protein
VNGSDMTISSNTGAVFATSNGGEIWFEIGGPTVFGSPGDNSLALAYGAPDPAAPEGVGNLGNFIYVGTSTGQIYLTQDGGGSGTSNNWINISTGLDGSQVESITTDPSRGSHAVYAVTKQGVYFLPNSIPSATNATPTWINITGTGNSNIHNLPYTIFGQTYNPTTDPNTITLNQAVTLSSIVADWEYTIPNSANDPAGPGYHPVLYVSANSGVYQSIDDGLTWSLFPSTTLGAEAQGGNLPHLGLVPQPVTGQYRSQYRYANPGRSIPGLRLYRHTHERVGLHDGHQQPDGADRGRERHRHRHPGRDDNPDRHQLAQHHHALGDRDGQRLPEPYRRQSHGHPRPRSDAGFDIRPRLVRHQHGAHRLSEHGPDRSQQRQRLRDRDDRHAHVRRPQRHHGLRLLHADHDLRRDRQQDRRRV